MHHNTTHTSEITVRLADHTDSFALHRLAALDSAQVPNGALVIAESDGELVAALPLDGGRAIADPFRGTAKIVEMLELRAAQLGTARDHGFAHRLRSVARLAPAA